MFIFAVQCKKNGHKNLTRYQDRGGINWILKVINYNNSVGIRTLVLIKE